MREIAVAGARAGVVLAPLMVRCWKSPNGQTRAQAIPA